MMKRKTRDQRDNEKRRSEKTQPGWIAHAYPPPAAAAPALG
jgi:hypothetical protein